MMKKKWIPQAIIIVVLVLGFNPANPYWYYTLLRWVCCVGFVYLTISAVSRSQLAWFFLFLFTAILYNPILIVPGTRALWTFVNLATIGLTGISIFALKTDQR